MKAKSMKFLMAHSPLTEKSNDPAASPPNGLDLTPRELEVMRLIAKGKLYKEIADRLGISFSAVHKHQQGIFRKFQVGNRTEAVIKLMLVTTDAKQQ